MINRIMHVPINTRKWVVPIPQPVSSNFLEEIFSESDIALSDWAKEEIELQKFDGESFAFGYGKFTKTLVIADMIR